MALISTVGASNADSYVSMTEANQYFASHWQITKATLWESFETSQRERLLRVACNLVDQVRVLDDTVSSGALVPALMDSSQLTDVRLHKLYTDQRLQFPRNLDHVDGDGYIPDAIKFAQCEQAIHLATIDDAPVTAQLLGVVEERTKVGSIEIMQRFGASRTGSGTTVSPLSQTMLSPLTLELLKPYMRMQRKLKRS